MEANNMKAMREALEDVTGLLESIFEAFSKGTGGVYMSDVSESIANARAALAAPTRNCDMPLVVDGPANNNADKAWLVFKRHNPDAYFDVPGLLRCIDWLLSPATKTKGAEK